MKETNISEKFDSNNYHFNPDSKFGVKVFKNKCDSVNDYMNLSPSDSLSLIKDIINEVKNVNGDFISVWHNESLNFQDRWSGWEGVYKEMIKYAIK